MLPILHIGPLAIQVPGLVLLLGLWLGLSLTERYAPRYGMESKIIYNLVILSILAGVVSARLFYVARFPDAFLSKPASIISLNPSLLDLWGGVFTAPMVALIYGRRMGLSFWSTLNALTPAMAVFSVALALAHLSSGSHYGMPTNLPWGIELWGAQRHPTQIYELIASLIILFILWPGRETFNSASPGLYFLSFLGLSAGASIFLDAFREDSPLLPGGIRIVQLIALIILTISLWGIKKLELR
jgi:phosphatidylglycerol:prolipoprotein diacylglycerol transferase